MSTVVWAASVAAAMAAVGLYVVLALKRAGHPFDLEWLEGGSVDHVRRVLAGRPLYTAPSVDFAAYTYPPLYFWLAAGVARVVGVGYFALRLVSIAASFATMAVIAVAVRLEVGRWGPGVVAAGVFAAAFAVTGAWYDVARVDSLFVFLLMASVAVVARTTSWRVAAGAGVLAGLAVLTKQTAVIVVAPLGLFLFVRGWRVGVTYAGTAAILAGGVSVVLNAASQGWYRYSVLDELVGQRGGNRTLGELWRTDTFDHLWPSLLVIAVAVLARRFRGPRAAYLVAAVGMIAGSWLSRAHSGGTVNVLIPMFAAVALLLGIALGEGFDRPSIRVIIASLVIVQLALLAYRPSNVLPHSDEVIAGRAFVAALRVVPGDVLVISHPEFAVRAGKAPHAHNVALSDVVRSGDDDARGRVKASLATAVHDRRYAFIVFDRHDGHLGFPADFDQYYGPVPAPYGGGHPRRPGHVTWWPTEWWAPR